MKYLNDAQKCVRIEIGKCNHLIAIENGHEQHMYAECVEKRCNVDKNLETQFFLIRIVASA